MTVQCGAGTPVEELDDGARRATGRRSRSRRRGTVGGALAVGRSGIRRLGYGPVRDTLLQARVRRRRRRDRQGRRADGQERQRLRSVPAARRLARHARIPRRGDPAHPAAGDVRAVVRRRRRSVRAVPAALPPDLGALGRHRGVGPARGSSRRRRAPRRRRSDSTPPIRPPSSRPADAGRCRRRSSRARRDRSFRRRGRRRHRAPRATRRRRGTVDPPVRRLHRRIKQQFDPPAGSTRASTCSRSA